VCFPNSLRSTSRVSVDAFSLTAVDTFGWWSKRQVITRSSLRGLIVEPFLMHQVYNGRRSNNFVASLTQIRAIVESGPPKAIAPAYPRELLAPIADELARLCTPPGSNGEQLLVANFQDKLSPFERIPFRRSRPSATDVQHEEHADGVTFVIPPLGIRKGSKGLFIMSLILMALSLVLFSLFLLLEIQQQADLPYLMPILVLLTGFVLFLVSVNVARRRAAIAVVGDRLMVMRSGLFGSGRREWDRSQLLDIRLGPSGLTRQNKTKNEQVLQLQIVTQDGKRYGMLTGREDAELEWIGAVLRQRLRLTGERPLEPAAESSSTARVVGPTRA
jgi:hypothetical protein